MDRFQQTSSRSMPPLVIAICGATGTGKSTFVCDASGQNFEIGHSQESCTTDVKSSAPFEVDGRVVVLIDTPGFDDTTLSDADVLGKIASFLKHTYAADQKLAGVIYMHRISDNRVGGVSRRNFHTFRELCGESSLVNVVIATNMWHDPPHPVELERETELMTSKNFFLPALEKKARSARYIRNWDRHKSHEIIRMFMSNTPMALQVQREMVDENKQLHETSAGKEVQGELQKLIEKHQRELEALKREMEDAMKRKDDETREELAEYRREAEKNSERVRNQMEKLNGAYTAELASRELAFKLFFEDHEKCRREDEERIAELNLKLQGLCRLISNVQGPARHRAEKEAENIQKEIRGRRANFWKRLGQVF